MEYKLPEPLLFEGSTRPQVSVEFPSDENKPDRLELRLRGRFNQKLAKSLDVPYLFTKNGSLVSGFTQMKLDAKIEDIQLKLIGGGASLDVFYPESVDRIVVTHEEGEGTTISMRVTTTGHFDSFIDFFRTNRVSGFSFVVEPRQQEMFEGGDRVAMSEGKEEPEPVIQ